MSIGGSAPSKYCDLRSSRFSRLYTLPSPGGGFPLRQALLVAEGATGLPLSAHCNPQGAKHRKQPRSFPRQRGLFLSLFCRRAFRRQKVILPGRGEHDLIPASCTSTQGRLRCTQHHSAFTCRPVPHAGYPQAVEPTTHLGLRGSGVYAHMPLRIAPQP